MIKTAAPSSRTSFTPSWKATSGDPAIVNGIISGSYARTPGGFLWMRVSGKIGSSTTTGTGEWYFELPLALSADLTLETGLGLTAANMRCAVGKAFSFDNGVRFDGGIAAIQYGEATKVRLLSPAGTGSFYQSTVPYTWADGDTFGFTATIPIVGWA
jgi:hypothetical protein